MSFWRFTDKSTGFPIKSSKHSPSPSLRKSLSKGNQFNIISALTTHQKNRKIQQLFQSYSNFKQAKINGQKKSLTKQNWFSLQQQRRPLSRFRISHSESINTLNLKQIKQKRKSLLQTIRTNNLFQGPVKRPRRTTHQRLYLH